mmetsp:Transcript_4143/g.5054  ORF Transcript_4143/g.5054 Transcript_4143/m.5054 type:complete len:140 (+) Transcript_4143:685-1104(+)
MLLLAQFQKSLGKDKWSKFLKDLKSSSTNKQTSISIDLFLNLLKKYDLFMTQKQSDDMLECLNLRDDGNSTDINIQPFFADLKHSKDIDKAYNKINLEEREDEEDMKITMSKLLPISEEMLLQILSEITGTKELIREIK